MSVSAAADPSRLVNRRELERFASDHLPPYERLTVELLSGGASNLTFLVRLDERRYVLRRRPLGTSAPKAHDMLREFTVLRELHGRGLPIPRVHAYADDERVVGAPFYLMDYCEGTVIHHDEDAARLDPLHAAVVSRDLVEVLARLHALDHTELDLDNFGRPGNFVERRILSWLRQWNSVEHREFPELERIGEILLKGVPEQRRTCLVHGDYRLGNVMLDAGTGRVSAVLDWEMSTVGDPLTDVAHLLVYWESTCGRPTHPAQLIANRDGFLSGGELVGLYETLTGNALDQLPFYLAFEHWRAAIIKDSIYLRRVAGQMQAGEDLEAFGRTVRLHLEEATEILDSVAAGHSLPGFRTDVRAATREAGNDR